MKIVNVKRVHAFLFAYICTRGALGQGFQLKLTSLYTYSYLNLIHHVLAALFTVLFQYQETYT